MNLHLGLRWSVSADQPYTNTEVIPSIAQAGPLGEVRVPLRVPSRVNFNGSFKASFKGSFKASFKGSFKASFKGSFKASFKGSFKASFKGSFKASFKEAGT